MTQEQFNALPLLLRRRQVQAATGFSRELIYNLVDAGELKAQLIGGGRHYFYLKESVARFIQPQLTAADRD